MQVGPIVDNVRKHGDAAVREYTAQFDRVQLDRVCVPIQVSARGGVVQPQLGVVHGMAGC